MQTTPFAVLTKHWPDVPKWRDIKDVTARSLIKAGIKHITILSGGFPCQPFSTSGKRKGSVDNRFLWPEMFRVIKESRPTWVLGENVNGIISMELDNALADLEHLGYSCRAFNIPAVAVGAWHSRQRVFIVATSNTGHRTKCTEQKHQQEIPEKSPSSSEGKIFPDNVSDSEKSRDGSISIQPRRSQKENPDINRGCKTIPDPERFEWSQFGDVPRMGWGNEQITWYRTCIWQREPGLGRVVDGVSSRMDSFIRQERCRALGNAVVPQQVYPILKAIADIEKTK